MSATPFQIDEEFWRDRLEVGIARVVQEHARDASLRLWIASLTPRCRSVLVEHFGLAETEEFKAALLARRTELLPFLLVDAAMEGKRVCAIEQLAQAKLSPEALAASQRPTLVDGVTSYDRRALLWRLYLADPAHLELVFHLDRLQRKGFARMVADDAPPVNGTDPGTFLTRTTLQGLLDRYEREQETQRQSHCAAILNGDGRYRVFIKRDMKEAFVSHGPKNTFGFSREWIILVFEQGLRRVQVCSVSPSVPPQLASRIATGFFGVPVNYTNEVVETPVATVAAFLHSLLADPARLPLVELVAGDCGLEGSPQLRLSAAGSASIAPAIQQFARAFSDPLADVGRVESLKVWFSEKRVKLTFEPADKTGASYVVRYADQPLDAHERADFEQLMWKDYGIRVLSTEKKHHAAAA
ncbi:MAG: hypothetical protein RBU45_08400 [Myxococcota bacterium]|jgi:hypothetical protein|nr:hypothetical protein [Myxococcota bacterium]